MSVKLVASHGVGLIAAGVAKAHADVVHVAGADGGTGASPLASIKHAGAPWELGLAETQQALVANGLRGRVRVRVDGGFKTGRDVLLAALLGADEFSFGTALLLAEGCLMVRSCHLDTCPVGIASQRPELRAKFAGTPEMVEAYLRFVALEVREHLAALGLRTIDEAVGRTDLLRQRRTGDPPRTRSSSTGCSCVRAVGRRATSASRCRTRAIGSARSSPRRARPRSAARGSSSPRTRSRTPTARSAPGSAARSRASRATLRPPAASARASRGPPGQSFGAFLTAGVELQLVGEANDYVGKAMSGGRIVISPPAGDAGEPCLVGNTVLYGATGGELFCAGSAGERFAVRNSGAVAVVEGVGDHACEYMTRGTVVVLGGHGPEPRRRDDGRRGVPARRRTSGS